MAVGHEQGQAGLARARESQSGDGGLRGRLSMGVAVMSALVAVIMGIDHLIHGPRVWGGVLILGALVLFAVFRALRRSARLEFLGNLVAGLWYMALVIAIYIRGGAGAPGMLMAGIVPVLAVLSAGWRSGLVWAGIVLFTQAAFTTVYALGYEFPVRVPLESQRFSDTAFSFVVTIVLAVFALSFEWYRIATTEARVNADRLRHEAEIEASLARADRLSSIGQISAGVAHEINNPLAYVLGNLEFIASELASPQERNSEWREELASAISDACEGGRQIQQIVADLNTYARKAVAEVQEFELQTSIQGALKILDNELRHQVTLHLELGTSAWVSGDPSRFTQVFLNLLLNAMHAARSSRADDNTIAIELSRMDGRVLVRVKDNGIGISPANLKRVTDPFFTTKTVGEGTGLGLSVSRNLVEQYGGRLSLQSEEGVGTVAEVSLPEVAAPTTHKSKVAVIDCEKLRILVVDDDKWIRRTLSRRLRHHEIVVACSASEALQLLAEQPDFDTILCDVMMPGKNGFELYDEVTGTCPAMAERFLFMSGGVFGASLEERVKRLDRPLLSKPIDMLELEDALLAVAQPRRALA